MKPSHVEDIKYLENFTGLIDGNVLARLIAALQTLQTIDDMLVMSDICVNEFEEYRDKIQLLITWNIEVHDFFGQEKLKERIQELEDLLDLRDRQLEPYLRYRRYTHLLYEQMLDEAEQEYLEEKYKDSD